MNKKVLLVTGGAGFIGSNFINFFLKRYKDFTLVNIDKLTYAGNLDNLKEIEGIPRYHFIKGDICSSDLVSYVFKEFNPDYIINFAAESHVDRSIKNPSLFIKSNVSGTLNLLQWAYNTWKKNGFDNKRFLQISTDEVYGSINNNDDCFHETSNLLPNSPYSASKASSDLLVRSFTKTYKMPSIITRCCNNYGPYQNVEKFVPTCITNALKDKPLPIYGEGSNIREWIHVVDHCSAVTNALFYGKAGEIYNIGTKDEISNINMAKTILDVLGKPHDSIIKIADRPGHDMRYALDSSKIKNELGWAPNYKLIEGIVDTIKWYIDNQAWWDK